MGSDRNSYIGLFLIGVILFAWIYLNGPSEKEKARALAVHDSIALVHKQDSIKRLSTPAPPTNTAANTTTANTTAAATTATSTADTTHNDSIIKHKKEAEYGILAPALHADFRYASLGNDLLTLTFSNKGGKICAATLTKFKTSTGTDLVLFYPDSARFGLMLNAYSKFVNTDSLYFSVKHMYYADNKDSGSLTMRLITADSTKYIEYVYSVKKGSYMVSCTMNVVGMQDILANNTRDIPLDWAMRTPSQETNMQAQQRTSTAYYKFYDDQVDYISPMKDDKKSITDVSWISFKQQFFSSILIANTRFSSPLVSTRKEPDSSHYVKYFDANMSIPYNHQPMEAFGMHFYFGPNNYQMLRHYSSDNDLQLDKEINLGWGIFGWVNRFIVIPLFEFLNQFNLNYGIVILILTIVLKALMFPVAFRTYVSSAKMRILKPEIDEISKKYPKTEDAMKKQQAVMALNKKAGVNPLAGCLPVLFQLPILYALFSFFPASIELRQQKFLWANDLSTYDSAIHFSHFSLPFLGDHISIFAILMTLSQYLYLTVNQQMMSPGATDQMGKTMKWMMYIMPIFFLGVLNNYSAGLSYYYFLANLITFGQTFLARLFINEGELHRKMQENKAKVIKPSKFQARLEQMMKEQQAAKRGK
jgi:YidC/Oxa1 family membrane protein insertase